MNSAARNTIMVGDVRECLAKLPDASVDCVITSPPYYLLRVYGVEGEIGLEDHVGAWVVTLRDVMRDIARVLKSTGTVYLNLGDSYSRHLKYGAPEKSMLLGPERLALALLADGWTFRNKVVWAKPNPLPTSVTDRLNTTWEPIYVLTRSPHYHYDLDAIRVPHRSARGRASGATPELPARRPAWAGPLSGSQGGLTRLKAAGLPGHRLGKNPGDVWSIPTANFRGQHFASFPTKLVERPLLASCPERTCRRCGRPWRREADTPNLPSDAGPGSRPTAASATNPQVTRATRLRPTCRCKAAWEPGLVLDPFFGAGTVGVVAQALGRHWIGIELSPQFARLARDRIAAARSRPGRVAA